MKTITKVSLLITVIGLLFSIPLNAQDQGNSADLKVKSSVMCGSCKARVEKNMAYVKGVKAVSVDLPTKEIAITYNPKKTTPEELKTAITKIGYDADGLPADSVAYSKLPACCKKDAAPHE